MRHFIAVITALLLLLALPGAAGESSVLLVGIDSYAHYPSLTRAGADARSLAAILARHAGVSADAIVVMDDRQDGTPRFPTAANIRARLAASCESATAGDRLLVFLSGRAVVLDGRAYLVPGDGDPAKPETLIPVAAVRDAMLAAKAPARLLLLDLAHDDAGDDATDPLPALRAELADAALATWVLHGASARSLAADGSARWLAALDLALTGFADAGPHGNRDGRVELAEAQSLVNARLAAEEAGTTTALGKRQVLSLAAVGTDKHVATVAAGTAAWLDFRETKPPAKVAEPLAAQYLIAANLLASATPAEAAQAYATLRDSVTLSRTDTAARQAAQVAREAAANAETTATQLGAVAVAPALFGAGVAQHRKAETAWTAGRVDDASAAWTEAAAKYAEAAMAVRRSQFTTAIAEQGELLATYGGDAWAAVDAARGQAVELAAAGRFADAAEAWRTATQALPVSRRAAIDGILALARSFDNAEGAATATMFVDQLLVLEPGHVEAIAMRRRLLSNHGFSPGQVVVSTVGIRFAYIPPGEFLMGSPDDEFARENDETPHRVTISHGYFLSVTEVTQAQFVAVMGADYRPAQGVHPNDRDPGQEGDELPKIHVTWDEAVLFCERLSERDGRRYRLPTEAEWEYACRAGTTGSYSHSKRTLTSQDANVYDPAGEPTATIVKAGTFAANKWGLYDMHGNVWEWCADVYAPYPAGDATDPTGPTAASREKDLLTRVLRGGSWYEEGEKARSANRWATKPAVGSAYIGLRLLMQADTVPRETTQP